MTEENVEEGGGRLEETSGDLVTDLVQGLVDAGYSVRQINIQHITGEVYRATVEDADRALEDEEIIVELEPPS